MHLGIINQLVHGLLLVSSVAKANVDSNIEKRLRLLFVYESYFLRQNHVSGSLWECSALLPQSPDTINISSPRLTLQPFNPIPLTHLLNVRIQSYHETAASAVRNLNNYEISGRPLRVAFADADKEAGPDGGPVNWSEEDSRRGVPGNTAALGATPRVLQGVTSSEAIAQAVASFQASQLTELLGHLKRILQTPTAPAPLPPIPVPAPIALPIAQPHVAPASAPSQAQLANLIEEQQKQLLLQVLNLTPEQISALPADQQQQILALRAQVLGV
ncbi:hypothetical protein BSLG_005200 [Batrachochytrium salamandrivorans]|nr:hypothetical protein BSLG_010633 [Batrachochytrium salamandrivorans]KAJ1340207.1 hypothetical protein BSLG_005200 [Batrachochytrium salamandrivorans]